MNATKRVITDEDKLYVRKVIPSLAGEERIMHRDPSGHVGRMAVELEDETKATALIDVIGQWEDWILMELTI